LEPEDFEAVWAEDASELVGQAIEVALVCLHARAGIQGKLDASPGGLHPEPRDVQQRFPAGKKVDGLGGVEVTFGPPPGTYEAEQGAGPPAGEQALEWRWLRALRQ
jgi:hypothetical protein